MREILFRGKDVDRKEWVYGGYSLYPHTRFPCKPTIYEVGRGCWHPVEVIPDTVGQYTGLKDKNGRRIFEGDIVKVKHGYAGNQNYPTAEYIEVVEYDARSCCYEFYRWSGDIYDVEVIGNIHDNPEMLKGENTNG